MPNQSIKLIAIDDDLFVAWQAVAQRHENVEAIKGDILETSADAWVSPANSFGFMDGGIDAVYLKHFGVEMQNTVQEAIYENTPGELLVGQALIVETNANPPALIVAPTMRVPMGLTSHTVNPYLAMRAVLYEVSAWNETNTYLPINTIVVPGLGTGVGGVSSAQCAAQVHLALSEHEQGGREFPKTWRDVGRHQYALIGS